MNVLLEAGPGLNLFQQKVWTIESRWKSKLQNKERTSIIEIAPELQFGEGKFEVEKTDKNVTQWILRTTTTSSTSAPIFIRLPTVTV